MGQLMVGQSVTVTAFTVALFPASRSRWRRVAFPNHTTFPCSIIPPILAFPTSRLLTGHRVTAGDGGGTEDGMKGGGREREMGKRFW